MKKTNRVDDEGATGVGTSYGRLLLPRWLSGGLSLLAGVNEMRRYSGSLRLMMERREYGRRGEWWRSEPARWFVAPDSSGSRRGSCEQIRITVVEPFSGGEKGWDQRCGGWEGWQRQRDGWNQEGGSRRDEDRWAAAGLSTGSWVAACGVGHTRPAADVESGGCERATREARELQ